jgi:hypothetical protein
MTQKIHTMLLAALVVISASSLSFAKVDPKNADMAVVTTAMTTTYMKNGKVLGTEKTETGRRIHYDGKKIAGEQAIEHAKKLADHPHAKQHGLDKDGATLFQLPNIVKDAANFGAGFVGAAFQGLPDVISVGVGIAGAFL